MGLNGKCGPDPARASRFAEAIECLGAETPAPRVRIVLVGQRACARSGASASGLTYAEQTALASGLAHAAESVAPRAYSLNVVVK